MKSLFSPRPPRRAPVSIERRVHELEIVTARLVRRGFAGQYHAAFHGRGIEFAQVREYQPGDDVRVIDWNVTARTGVPHVKEFVEERDLTVILAVDLSGSMDFGSMDRRKIDLAAELTAVLSYAAFKNRDRVGLVTFSRDVVSYIPPRRGRNQVQRVVRQAIADAASSKGEADFRRLTRFLDRVMIRRAVVIVLSDFLDAAAIESIRRLGSRHDVVALALHDPREKRFPTTGLVRLVDGETGRRVTVDLRRARVEATARALEEQRLGEMKRAAIDAVFLSTVEPYDRELLRFFNFRVARMR